MRVVVEPRDRLKQKGVIDAITLDRTSRTIIASMNDEPDFTIDLSKAKYIDHDCLLLIGGFTSFRKRRGLATKIELPANVSVADYLNAWNFPEYLASIQQGGRPFTALSDSHLAEYPGADNKYISYRKLAGRQVPLLLKTSLQITPIAITGEAFADAALATERFLQLNFLSVLNRALGRRGESGFAGIAREAVLNAATHPAASIAYTSCHIKSTSIDEWSLQGRDVELQLCIWDDGESFATTLGKALRDTGEITTDRYGEEGAVFEVTLKKRWDRDEDIIEISDKRPPDYNDEVLLSCAAFMLGISSDPNRSLQLTPEATITARRKGGVGLALLRSTAIDTFRGRVEYRSQALRIEISGGDRPGTYRFAVALLPEFGWPVRGNLLTVTLPIAADML